MRKEFSDKSDTYQRNCQWLYELACFNISVSGVGIARHFPFCPAGKLFPTSTKLLQKEGLQSSKIVRPLPNFNRGKESFVSVLKFRHHFIKQSSFAHPCLTMYNYQTHPNVLEVIDNVTHMLIDRHQCSWLATPGSFWPFRLRNSKPDFRARVANMGFSSRTLSSPRTLSSWY